MSQHIDRYRKYNAYYTHTIFTYTHILPFLLLKTIFLDWPYFASIVAN